MILDWLYEKVFDQPRPCPHWDSLYCDCGRPKEHEIREKKSAELEAAAWETAKAVIDKARKP